ncbi:MAG: hypothetical protein JXO22_00115 [Phycisphaerae bacterium]|nr:hypothetical protein [Phycisphaerae bacterium]
MVEPRGSESCASSSGERTTPGLSRARRWPSILTAVLLVLIGVMLLSLVINLAMTLFAIYMQPET